MGTIGAVPHPRSEEPLPESPEQPQQPQEPAADPVEWAQEDAEFGEIAYEVFSAYTHQHNDYPSVEVLDIHLSDGHNVRHPRSAALLRRLLPGFKQRFDNEMAENHIA